MTHKASWINFQEVFFDDLKRIKTVSNKLTKTQTHSTTHENKYPKTTKGPQ